MTIFKAAGNAAVLVDSPVQSPAERTAAIVGWDPYEVWRTRVMPQSPSDLAVARTEQAAKPRLVRSA